MANLGLNFFSGNLKAHYVIYLFICRITNEQLSTSFHQSIDSGKDAFCYCYLLVLAYWIFLDSFLMMLMAIYKLISHHLSFLPL